MDWNGGWNIKGKIIIKKFFRIYKLRLFDLAENRKLKQPKNKNPVGQLKYA